MTRVLEMRSVVVVVLVAVALSWSTGAFAQATSPGGAKPQAQPGQMTGGSMVEGKITNVSGSKVTLADGTELVIPSDVKVQRADLKPGATVKASFEERGGQKVVTNIAVEPAK